MEPITYLNAFDSSKRDGQKLAKISQEKMKALSGKYHTFLKSTVVAPQQETVTPVVSNPEPVVAPVQPVVNNVVAPANTPSDNYAEIMDAYALTAYDKSFDEKPLTGARKIRVNPKVLKHALGLGRKYGKEKLADMKEVSVNTNEVLESITSDVSSVNTPLVEETKPAIAASQNVVELPKTTSMVNETVSKEVSSPSVDDYLQKEVPNQENGLIIQLTGDVEGLKEETVKRAALLEKLEAQYNAIKDQKAKRIKELEEEKLSYTATLEGLTERIRNLQAAIQKEEESLGYKKAA